VRESTIEKYLVKEIKRHQGVCIKLTGVMGIPDRLVLFKGGLLVFAELKTATGKLTPLQIKWSKFLISLGFYYIVIRSKQEVDQFIQQYLKNHIV
jgi:hypothetical protein